MAELIWRLVLKINARAVFLLTLLLLCVVLVALLRGGGRQEGTLKVSGHRVQLAGGGPGESQAGPGPAWAETIEDPFTSAFLVAWLDLEASRKREREAVRAQQAAAEEAAAEQVEHPSE